MRPPTPPPQRRASEPVLQKRYAEALALHRQGKLDEAEIGYRAILEQQPDTFHVLHMLGVLHGQRDDWVEAERLIAAAVAVDPGVAAAHANLGNARRLLYRRELALESYELAILLDPDNIRALKGQGLLLFQGGQPADALFVYDRLLTLEPDYADGRALRAVCLDQLGRREEALAAYQTVLDPERKVEWEKIRYLLASRGVGEVPASSPAHYIQDLFDTYARRFDDHLVRLLRYRGPEIILEALQPHLGAALHETVDLGCGTGLCGVLLRPHASRVVGVDLSPGMLEVARLKGVYDDLTESDLIGWLSSHPAAVDLAVAADVVVYLGDLQPLFSACRGSLRPGGLFAFTTERCEGTEPHLGDALRYEHPEAYLHRLAEAGGWRLLSQTTHVIREERGKAVDGHLTVLRRAN